MENYKHIPNSVKTPLNMNIAGGTINKIDTPSVAYIASKGDIIIKNCAFLLQKNRTLFIFAM